MIIDEIILASQSPRRKELLQQLGLEFRIMPAIGEEVMCGNSPDEIVKNLAEMKAKEVADTILGEVTENAKNLLVIGADTVVVNEGKILGKPKDESEAALMLRGLSGKEHSVFTGVCFIQIIENQAIVTDRFAEETKVQVYPMTEQDISDYIQTGEPMDKAGAYGIQGRFARHVGAIKGEYNTVVGLPIGRLWQSICEIQKL